MAEIVNTPAVERMAREFAPGTLGSMLESRVAQTPDKTFLFSEADRRRYTYAEFDDAVNRTARLLASFGIGARDTVSLLLPNSVEYLVAYFACFKLGAVAGPVNSLLKPREMAFVINDSEAKAVLFSSQYAAQVEEVRSNQSDPAAYYIEFDDEARARAPGEGYDAAPAGAHLSPDDDAIIIYTSGTTGKPKGCLLSHGNLIANARQIAGWLGLTTGDRLLTVMPLFHMNAVSVTTVSALFAGGSTVVSPRFSASRFWNIISEYRVTSFGSVATMLQMLLTTYPGGVPKGLDTTSLRFALCGSAPVPAEILRRFEETFNCLVIEGYGLSESTCRSTFNPPDERRRPGSCGLPIGNEMRVVDDEDHEVPDGQPGEIVLRGPNVFKGYYRNPQATERAFRGGWFHTGDIGYRDADGYFFIVDRKSDMIIRGGENIYPREIDEVLYQHPKVAAAATIGIPDPLYGEEVCAFIALRDGAAPLPETAEELMEFCRARLADYKCPRSIRFLDEIPKGPTGKLLKRELARMARGEGATSRPIESE